MISATTLFIDTWEKIDRFASLFVLEGEIKNRILGQPDTGHQAII